MQPAQGKWISTLKATIPRQHDVDLLVQAAMEKRAWPGISVAVVHCAELAYIRGLGLARSRDQQPVAPSTVFRVGSIAKTFTAIGLMRLWERGLFHLDEPVNHYLKGYRVAHRDPRASAVTFRHLLTHTAGLGALRRYSDMLHSTGRLTVKAGQAVPSLPSYYAPVLRAELYPGTRFSYSNHDYATLGQLIADISGEPFEQYMLRHVFAPLGMQQSDYTRSPCVQQRLAEGYKPRHAKGQRLRREPDIDIIPGPAGAAFSSACDLAQYMIALMNGGQNQYGSVLRPETLELMTTPHYRVDDRLPAMGLGFMLSSASGHKTIGHDGGLPGFTSSLLVVPEAGLGIVAMTNTFDESIVGFVRHLSGYLLGRPVQHASPARRMSQPDRYHELCGAYGPGKGVLTNLRFWSHWSPEVRVLMRDGHLVMRTLWPWGVRGKGLRLYPADHDDPLFFHIVVKGQRVPVLFARNKGQGVDAVYIGLYFALRKRTGLRSLHARMSLIPLAATLWAVVASRPRRRR